MRGCVNGRSSGMDATVRALAARLPVRAATAARAFRAEFMPLRLVVVHWKIKPGREAEFLDYWASPASIPDRSGLISEFLSGVADAGGNGGQHPWTTLRSFSPRWTSYFNVGLWRDAGAFEDQIGRHIDDTRPLLDFEAERRERVFLAPERWRRGASQLPAANGLEGVRNRAKALEPA